MEDEHRGSIDTKIEAMVGGRDRPQKEIVDEIRRVMDVSDRTILGHLRRLDGRTVKRVRDGRAIRVYSMKQWRERKDQNRALAISHARNLRLVIDLFVDELPTVDPFGVRPQAISIPIDTALISRHPPKSKFDFERQVLFEDLLEHLKHLQLPTQPAKALPAFKRAIVRLHEAQEVLKSECSRLALRVFGLPITPDWSDASISERSIALTYRNAIKAITLKRRDDDSSDRDWGGDIREIGGYLEYWKNGVGLVRRKADIASSPEEFKAWVERCLARITKAAQTGSLGEAANDVVQRAKYAQAIRNNLVGALQVASYHEIFPGTCQFAGPIDE